MASVDIADSVTVLHLNEDVTGESHFDDFDIALPLKPFAPPAAPFYVSAVQHASGYVVIRIPVGWEGEPHPSPHRQILFCLSGALRVTASDGDVRTVKAGDTWLMEDTRGKGHQSAVVSDQPFEAVIIVLPDKPQH